MAKKNNFKRIRKIASIAEHNRQYALKQDVNKCPEVEGFKVVEGNGVINYLPVESPPKPATPSLGQLFSFVK